MRDNFLIGGCCNPFYSNAAILDKIQILAVKVLRNMMVEFAKLFTYDVNLYKYFLQRVRETEHA